MMGSVATGQPVAVRLRRALSCARGETWAGATTEVRAASAPARSSSSNKFNPVLPDSSV